jgi:hypothetical protein
MPRPVGRHIGHGLQDGVADNDEDEERQHGDSWPTCGGKPETRRLPANSRRPRAEARSPPRIVRPSRTSRRTHPAAKEA